MSAPSAVDNDVYNRYATSWRDENHYLSLLVSLTPPRVSYVHDVLTAKARLQPSGTSVLDVGCGGGLMAEEMARLGWRVTGVDPSGPSVEVARAHALGAGLDISYEVAAAESLPFADATFDAVYCCDVLEHVEDLDRAIAESARVLKSGGIYVYDTVNRSVLTRLVAITLFQDLNATSIMPRNFHVWEKFITPSEMGDVLQRHSLQSQEKVGFVLAGNPLALLRLLRKRKRGQINYVELGRHVAARTRIGRNLSGSYGGYAIKSSTAP